MSAVVARHDLDSIFRNSCTCRLFGHPPKENPIHCIVPTGSIIRW